MNPPSPTPTASLPTGRILFVDDEAALLQGVERSLRSTRTAWLCEFVDSPAAALDLLRQTPFQVVVSDMQMPGMSGAELLAQARELAPDTVRMMLTGNADLQTAMAAVNQGHIFQFLLKPCEGDRLIQSVTAALLQHHLQIAEREILQMQLETSDKMVAIGKLAAGITHDLNNILGAILIQTELELRDARDKSAPENPALSLIHEAATSAAALTRDLNCFSRCERIGSFQNLKLADLIESSLRLARPLLKNKLKLHTAVAADLPALLGDAEKLKQALINLLLNARDATPDGGEIWVTAQRHTEAEGQGLKSSGGASAAADANCPASDFRLQTSDSPPGAPAINPQPAARRPGSYVCLAVRDTGCGMDAATQQHIQNGFHTTKPSGKGSGLGLFMVRRVVGQHAGWLELESAPGRGSTFRLYLPLPEIGTPKSAIETPAGPPKLTL